jgi:hypothetical protein
MVHHYYEHRSSFNHNPSIAVQRRWPPGHFSYSFRLECGPVRAVYSHLVSSICLASKNIPGCASTSASEFVSGDLPCGSCNDRQHDNSGLCTSLGSGHGHLCVGSLVDCRCAGSNNVLPPDLRDVRHPFTIVDSLRHEL